MMAHRLQGFRRAMAEYGAAVPEDWVVPTRMIENAPDFNHLGEIFRNDGRPTGVVSMDDPLSIGLNGFLLTLGLTVPADVSIVSFNNTQAGQYHSPALTSIDVHPRELGIHGRKREQRIQRRRQHRGDPFGAFRLRGRVHHPYCRRPIGIPERSSQVSGLRAALHPTYRQHNQRRQQPRQRQP